MVRGGHGMLFVFRARQGWVIRHDTLRPNGGAGDTVMYRVLSQEWSEVERHLELRLNRYSG